MKRKGVLFVLGAVALLAVVLLFRRVRFDWGMFWAQLRHVSWWHIAAGVALIWGTYWLRSVRWAEFCRAALRTTPTGERVRARDLLGPQFVGFTAVALFGRLADLVRPYLLARRTGLTVSSQVAVYTVERMFDLGAAAVVFSTALALSPANLEHRDRFVRVGVGSLLATLVIAVFAAAVRIKGDAVAAWLGRRLQGFSPKVASGVEEKILGFREGLRAVSTVREFGLALGLSLVMWVMIGAAYLETAVAFVDTPELAGLSFSRVMLMVAVSLGGSLVQLPVLGWFTQIAVMATAMHGFYGAPIEAATACGAMMLLVTTLSIVPPGLVFARMEGVSLKTVAGESGTAEA